MSLVSALRLPLAAVAAALALAGCATNNIGCQQPASPAAAPAVQPADRIAYVAPIKLLAVGYGSPGAYSQYTHAQQKLMAIRAAQVDAYRNLAEQVYGFRVWGNTAVSGFATQNDAIRTYVDAFIRGARVVNTSSIADGNWEVTVELEISPQFLEVLRSGGNPANPNVRATIPGGCSVAGCTSPSAAYVSY